MHNFAEIYTIMEQSFPKSEIRDYEGQKALLNRTDYSIEIESIQGEVKGFLAAFDFESFYFIEHLATAEKYRNLGLGKQMMEKCIQKQSKLIVLEVEKPNSEMSQRRIGFYKRLGFFLNEDFQYRQPPLQEDCQEVWLQIMSFGRKMTLGELKILKGLLFENVYMLKNED